MLCGPASEERCSFNLFILHPQSTRDCYAVADTQHGLSTGSTLQDQTSQEGTTPRARAEDNLAPDAGLGVTKDQGITFRQWVPQLQQLDTRLS